MNLPAYYDELTPYEKKSVRQQYRVLQNNNCWYCKTSLDGDPAEIVANKTIKLSLFPDNFLMYPVHLQHDHNTGLTEGAVHAYCNAVLWQYEGK